MSCVCCVILGVTNLLMFGVFAGNTYGDPPSTAAPAGWAKGKGWAGRIKRWGGKRGPMTHGSKHHRTPRVQGGVQGGTG